MGARPAPSPLSSRLVVLRHRDFRLLWRAEAVSAVGSQMHTIAANWQALQLLGTRVYHLSVGSAHRAVAAAPLGLSALGLAAPVSFDLAYAFYALTGVVDTVSYVIRTTIRQLLPPDTARGRMAGLHLLLGSGGPELGELEAGLVASVAGVPAAIVAGGLVTMALTAWIARSGPDLRAYMGLSGPQ